jgi:RNA polymerase sigma-70 factor (sigma-E family)
MMVVVEAPEEVTGSALAQAHRDHYRSLVKLAALLIDDVALCEEIVQEAFVSVFLRSRRLDDPSKLAAYLRSAVLNGARSSLRRRMVRERPATLRLVSTDEGAGPTDPTGTSAELDADQRAVLLALRALPHRQRDALALRFWGELSEREIAEALGIAAGTVKTHIARGLAALAIALEDHR